MLALPLRLPTAPYGGHMGHFLLSTLILAGSTPFGNKARATTVCLTLRCASTILLRRLAAEPVTSPKAVAAHLHPD